LAELLCHRSGLVASRTTIPLASRSSWTAFDHRHVIARLAKLIAQKSTGIVNDHLVEQIA